MGTSRRGEQGSWAVVGSDGMQFYNLELAVREIS